MTTYKVQLITSDGRRYSLSVEDGQHVLDAALESGLNIPYSSYQSWLLSNNYEIRQNLNKTCETPETNQESLFESNKNSQDLLDKLLSDFKRKKSTRIHRMHVGRKILDSGL